MLCIRKGPFGHPNHLHVHDVKLFSHTDYFHPCAALSRYTADFQWACMPMPQNDTNPGKLCAAGRGQSSRTPATSSREGHDA